MHLCTRRLSALFGLSAALVFTLSTNAFANPIDPGFDRLLNPSGASEIDLSLLGLGIVPLEGVPLLPDGTDTIIERIDPGPLAGSSGIIDIEIVALSLMSVDPVDLTPLGGPFVGVFGDIFLTIDRDNLFGLPSVFAPSLGAMNIVHPLNLHAGGGFDMCFGNISQCNVLSQPSLGVSGGGIFGNLTTTFVGGDPTNPLDVLFHVAVPQMNLASTGNWVHDPRGGAFPNGNLLISSISTLGPLQFAPVPEPGSALLVGGGLLALLGAARRNRR